MTVDTAIILPVILLILIFLISAMGEAFVNCEKLNDRLEKNTEEWSRSQPGRIWSGVGNEIK